MQDRSKVCGRLVLGAVVLALVAAPGCGSNELESPTAKKLKALANFYLDYTVAQNGKGPASEPVLKKHIRTLPGFILQGHGVEPDAINAVFGSERDGEPFVVLYGATIAKISGNSTQLVAHEKTGKGGKRLVVYVSAKVDLVDESRLQELIAGKQ